jgi:hypothetical protein
VKRVLRDHLDHREIVEIRVIKEKEVFQEHQEIKEKEVKKVKSEIKGFREIKDHQEYLE